jgi:Trm5-related predicted tRNA methylase
MEFPFPDGLPLSPDIDDQQQISTSKLSKA